MVTGCNFITLASTQDKCYGVFYDPDLEGTEGVTATVRHIIVSKEQDEVDLMLDRPNDRTVYLIGPEWDPFNSPFDKQTDRFIRTKSMIQQRMNYILSSEPSSSVEQEIQAIRFKMLFSEKCQSDPEELRAFLQQLQQLSPNSSKTANQIEPTKKMKVSELLIEGTEGADSSAKERSKARAYSLPTSPTSPQIPTLRPSRSLPTMPRYAQSNSLLKRALKHFRPA